MRKMFWIVLSTLLILASGCGPGGETPTPTSIPTPTLAPIKVVPTPTPVPAPPTPTPMPTPTPVPTPASAETPEPTAPPVMDIMIEIPAGSFIMGSDTGDPDEAPAHEVDLPAFEIDRFEVTNADFAQFVEATGYQTDAEKEGRSKNWRDDAEGKDNHPVVRVSWNDAVAYCEWLGKRLPTEAEWEKAARGTDGRTYPWGDEWDPSKANVKETGLRGTAAVGSFGTGASPYGVEDMAGNAWEWTADWYEPYPGSTYDSEYFGQKFKVVRGGGWFEMDDAVRTTNRDLTSVTASNDDMGFRCTR